MTNAHFMGIAMQDLIEHRVEIKFNIRKNMSKNTSSWFNDDTKLQIVINNFDFDFPEVFETFIHEYCHFLQWKEKDGIVDYMKWDKSVTVFFEWLARTRKRCPEKYLYGVQECELDCDRRVIELIKKHDLKVDIDDYIQQSNAYILSFRYAWEKRIPEDKPWPECYHASILKYAPKKHFTKEDLPHLLERFPDYFMGLDELTNSASKGIK